MSFEKCCNFYQNNFLIAITFFSCNVLLKANALTWVSMNNQGCRAGLKKINVNSNEPLFYPYSTKVNKYSRSCNNISDPYAKLCSPDVVKNVNAKLFNLMFRTNETRHTKFHETCKGKCIPDASVCNNKQRWNKDKCWHECKELIYESRCDKGFIWNPRNCDC